MVWYGMAYIKISLAALPWMGSSGDLKKIEMERDREREREREM